MGHGASDDVAYAVTCAARLSERYASIGGAAEVVSDPLALLQDVIRKELCFGRTERQQKRASALAQRLNQIREEAGASENSQRPTTDAAPSCGRISRLVYISSITRTCDNDYI